MTFSHRLAVGFLTAIIASLLISCGGCDLYPRIPERTPEEKQEVKNSTIELEHQIAADAAQGKFDAAKIEKLAQLEAQKYLDEHPPIEQKTPWYLEVAKILGIAIGAYPLAGAARFIPVIGKILSIGHAPLPVDSPAPAAQGKA